MSAPQAVTNAIAIAGKGPVAIADVQDKLGTKASSDTTGLLRELVLQKAPNAMLGLIHDPMLADKAYQVDVGNVFLAEIDGRCDGDEPFVAELKVEWLSDDKCAHGGEMYGGGVATLGSSAALWWLGTDVQVVIISIRNQCIDLAHFRHFDFRPETARIVCAKSTAHFRVEFDPIAQETLLFAVRGQFPCILDKSPYNRLRSGVRRVPNGPIHQLTSAAQGASKPDQTDPVPNITIRYQSESCLMSNDPLLQPFQLKHLTLKNRIMTTSHEPAYPEDGMPKERYAAYHAERAKAGVALAMTAGSAAVSKDSPPVFNNILAYKDEVVPWIRKLTDACHAHDCAVMIQLTHLGRRTAWNKGDWLPSVSSSKHREPAHRAFPKLIEDWDIERIITDFADAAERMRAGGMDGIELQVYGHLLDQFWSPLTNDLTGPYGADTLENRLRFPLDVLSAIRKRVGNKFIVGFRYTADEAQKGGITPDEGIEISKTLASTGQLDFLNVIRGRIHTDPAMTDVIPVQGMPSAPHLDFAGAVRKATGMPTFHAARIPDVATARHAVQSGRLDMVGMTRAHMADPHIVKKIIEGREDDIRPCVGATYCLDRIYQAGDALCIHNPATGRELSMPHEIELAPAARKVVIIGAGPAGLEAARVAAERGHQVVVFEAQPDPGGQIRLTVQNPRRREMIGIVDWRMTQCAARDVVFRFNTWAEIEDVLAENPDVVIVATGGLPNLELFETGQEAAHVISAWDIISGDVKPTGEVLIYDESGDHPALQAAEVAATAGLKVEVMTPDRTFAPEIMAMNLVPYMRSLQHKDVTFTVTRRLTGVARNGNRLTATIGTDYSDHTETRDYDQIVVNYGTMPLDALYFDLRPFSTNDGAVNQDALIAGQPQQTVRNSDGAFQLFRIGDAVSARNTHAAIYDALRLMKDV